MLLVYSRFLEDISSAEDLQWSKTLQGLDSLFTTIVGELPFFFISGWRVFLFGSIIVFITLECTI